MHAGLNSLPWPDFIPGSLGEKSGSEIKSGRGRPGFQASVHEDDSLGK